MRYYQWMRIIVDMTPPVHKKIKTYLLYLPMSAVVSGLYGAVHNQCTYSLSPEYFTRFKFLQFNVEWAYDAPRLGAAFIGALASWWVGGLICALLDILAFRRCEGYKMMSLYLGRAFAIVMCTALFFGLFGAMISYFLVHEENLLLYAVFLRPDILEPVRFVQAGFIHNASYLGAVLGTLMAIVYLHRSGRGRTL